MIRGSRKSSATEQRAISTTSFTAWVLRSRGYQSSSKSCGRLRLRGGRIVGGYRWLESAIRSPEGGSPAAQMEPAPYLVTAKKPAVFFEPPGHPQLSSGLPPSGDLAAPHCTWD